MTPFQSGFLLASPRRLLCFLFGFRPSATDARRRIMHDIAFATALDGELRAGVHQAYLRTFGLKCVVEYDRTQSARNHCVDLYCWLVLLLASLLSARWILGPAPSSWFGLAPYFVVGFAHGFLIARCGAALHRWRKATKTWSEMRQTLYTYIDIHVMGAASGAVPIAADGVWRGLQ